MDLDSKLRRVAEALLTQGEELRGVCVATQVGMFKGRQVLLAVTDGRLLVQGMNRKFEPVGDAISCRLSGSPTRPPRVPEVDG